MEKDLNYNQAFEALEALVNQLEDGEIELEELPAKIKQANELIQVCELKLRKTNEAADDAAQSFMKT